MEAELILNKARRTELSTKQTVHNAEQNVHSTEQAVQSGEQTNNANTEHWIEKARKLGQMVNSRVQSAEQGE